MKKLTLNRQVIRNLDSDEAANAQGGTIILTVTIVSAATSKEATKRLPKSAREWTKKHLPKL